MTVAAAIGPSAYWYLTRGTGIVSLVLLTLSLAGGIVNVRRLRPPAVPRFVLDALHRNVSLLAVCFTGVHIITSLLDGFAPIRVIDVVIPFTGPYRPLWLGLGTVAFDLLIAVTLTSMMRRRLGYRAWRLTHWTAYACWPVALMHGLGTGSDVKLGWTLAITGVCVLVVVAAVGLRLAPAWPAALSRRAALAGAAALLPVALIVFLADGPLAADWARRAGTPRYLLASAVAPSRSSTPGVGTGAGAAAGGGSIAFTAPAAGSVRQGDAGGETVVDITEAVSGAQLSELHIRIAGPPLPGGGVQMTSSLVTIGTASNPTQFQGTVTGLEGTNIRAELRSASGRTLRLLAQLQVDAGAGTAAGTVTVGGG